MNIVPLRYNISNWHQAVECLSNTSENLHIVVSDLIQNDSICGLKLSVVHDTFGVLFAYVVDASGDIVDSSVGPMPTDLVLKELSRYGFDITFNARKHLSGDQLQFLMTLNQMHFDKIRLLTVKNTATKTNKTVVVAFQVAYHPTWLDNRTTVYESEFLSALSNGSAMNVSLVSQSQHFNWDWLDFVADINDVLNENA